MAARNRSRGTAGSGVLVGLLFLLGAGQSWAEDALPEVTGELTLSSEYVFRGVSQTQEDPALQLGVDLLWDFGLHVGAWASNVDFTSAATAEIDLVLGWEVQLTRSLRLEAGGQLFSYAEESELNYLEYYLEVGFGEALTVAARYTSDVVEAAAEAGYLEASYVILPLHDGPEWELHAGYSTFEEGPDVLDYMLRVGWRIRSWGLDLAFWNTDPEEGGVSDLADERVVLTVSLDF
jgi:uncharacterized protein (TIGR02001 family)